MYMEQSSFAYPPDKEDMYPLLLAQLGALLDGERHVVPNLANASALLAGALSGINWAGFYLTDGGSLLLGPFQGGVACVRIPFGRGVCGTAAVKGETQVVPDVHRFPGHIACDSASNSEIVVPLRCGGRVVGVLDIDSPLFARFDDTDAQWLEKCARLIGEGCDWQCPGA